MDNRPLTDHLIAPISLLYDGFGVFEDLRQGCHVDGEKDIIVPQLWDRVGDFAEKMAKFYDTEEPRRAAVIECLDAIFGARTDPGGGISAGKIGALNIITDGHLNGAHGGMVFGFECKNELSTTACEPSAELVSYIASSFKELTSGDHKALFDRWRFPALGMTQIGEWFLSTCVRIFLTAF
jgi:hypothetical protein